MEAISLIPAPLFLLNTVLDDKRNFLNIFAGHIAEAIPRVAHGIRNISGFP